MANNRKCAALVFGDAMVDEWIRVGAQETVPSESDTASLCRADYAMSSRHPGGAANVVANLVALLPPDAGQVVAFGPWMYDLLRDDRNLVVTADVPVPDQARTHEVVSPLATMTFQNWLSVVGSKLYVEPFATYMQESRLPVKIRTVDVYEQLQTRLDLPETPLNELRAQQRYTMTRLKILLDECSPHVLVVSDYCKGAVGHSLTQAVIPARDSTLMIVDPGPGQWQSPVYKNADVMVINWAQFLTASSSDINSLSDTAKITMAGKRLASAFASLAMSSENNRYLIVTCGSHGFFVAYKKNGEICVDWTGVSAVSPAYQCGASDAFVAGLASYFAKRRRSARPESPEMYEALMWAMLTAEAAVSIPRTAVVHPRQVVSRLRLHMQNLADSSQDPLAVKLQKIVCGVRAGGYKVAFTNGCFDLPHEGHAHCLRGGMEQFAFDAAPSPLFTIVAVDSDERVRQLKGADRPVTPWEERAQFCRDACGPDSVVVCLTQDVNTLFQQMAMPDYYFKGATSGEPNRLPGMVELTAAGVPVHIVPELKGFSTTAKLAVKQKVQI